MLQASLFSFDYRHGRVDASVLPGKGSRALVRWAAFADSQPWSDAADISPYAQGSENVSKLKAAPNSRREVGRSAVVWELLKALGHEMPVITIYSPLPSSAFTFKEHRQLWRGNFNPSAAIMEEAVLQAQDRLHGPKSETQLDKFDLYGVSLGASNAIGAAAASLEREREVTSLTLQELIMAQSYRSKYARQYRHSLNVR